jgi:hypothetical protein
MTARLLNVDHVSHASHDASAPLSMFWRIVGGLSLIGFTFQIAGAVLMISQFLQSLPFDGAGGPQ